MGASEKMVLSQSVAVQNKRRTRNVNIQNVCHLQKQDECQRDREDLLLQENRAVAQANVGGKPTNVKTFTKRKKAAKGYAAGYNMDQSIKGDYRWCKNLIHHMLNIIQAMRNDLMRKYYSKGTMPPRNKKNFRPTKSGAGMTRAGVKAYRRLNPGSKLKTAVTGKVKPGSKAAKRRKSFCARSARTNEKISKSSKRS